MPDTRPIILIIGPTAGGKTHLAVELAGRLPGGGECICADSMQVYRGMDLGTAKPTTDEQARAPHHLIDIADPASDGFSVDAWLRLCEQTIEDVRSRGRWPIVVGGTNLYIQALLEGLFDGPPPDPELRERLGRLDPETLRRRLETVDPDAAAQIHANDRRRTIRALEVHEQTGRPMSAWQSQWQQGPPRDDVILLGLDYPAEAINRRINARVRAMLEAGLVEEVRRLHEAGALGPQAREALGYRQIIEHLEGRSDLEEAVEQIKIRTRRFAKQQRTWIRRFRHHRRAAWLIAAEVDMQTLINHALREIERLAGTPAQAPPSPRSPATGFQEGA
jgi:tRNA dimethylallyltransferase